MTEKVKKQLLETLKNIDHFDKLKFIYLYGSKATGHVSKMSDVDVCLYYDIKDKKKLFDMLIKIMGSVPDNFDIKMFQLLPLFVKKEVFKGKMIFCRDKPLAYDLAYDTFREWEDFERCYKFYILNTKEHPHRFEL